jgi:hypothetical protein
LQITVLRGGALCAYAAWCEEATSRTSAATAPIETLRIIVISLIGQHIEECLVRVIALRSGSGPDHPGCHM